MGEHKTVYHYTSRTEWGVMNRGNREYNYYNPDTGKAFKSSKVRGLWPRDPFIPAYVKDLPSESYLPVSYALMEPEPPEWIRHGTAWLHLIGYLNDGHDSKTILLEVNLLPSDKAFVVDAALLRLTTGQNIAKQQELYQQRWENRVPLEEYIKKEYAGASFSLPEVIIPRPIPLKRLKKVWEKDRDEVYRRAERLCERKVA